MNKVVLLGFISQEPTTSEYSEKNTTRTKFSILVNDLRNFNQSFFFNCVAWNQVADTIQNHFHKGDFVAIDGRLTNRSYIKPDGQKSYITEVIVDNIKNLGTRKDDESNNQQLNSTEIKSNQADVDELIRNNLENDHVNDNDDRYDDDQDFDDNDDVDWN